MTNFQQFANFRFVQNLLILTTMISRCLHRLIFNFAILKFQIKDF